MDRHFTAVHLTSFYFIKCQHEEKVNIYDFFLLLQFFFLGGLIASDKCFIG